jgi:transcriptional regulator with XRE-family HTH domain
MAICHVRETMNLSQAEFGRRLGVQWQAVSNWERAITDPRWGMLHRIAGVAGTTIVEIVRLEMKYAKNPESSNRRRRPAASTPVAEDQVAAENAAEVAAKATDASGE